MRIYPTPKWKLALIDESLTWKLSREKTQLVLNIKLREASLDRKLQQRLAYKFKRDKKIQSAQKWQQQNRSVYLKGKRDNYKRKMSHPVELEKLRSYARNRKRERILSDTEYALKCRLRCRISRAVKNGYKIRRTEELCGCSYTELKMRIESMFEPGMTWQNWTKSENGWHLDHRVPCNFFDLTNPQHQKRCFHFSNLQPLWSSDNLRKADKLESSL